MVRVHLKDGTYHDVNQKRILQNLNFSHLGHWLRKCRQPKIQIRRLRESQKRGRHRWNETGPQNVRKSTR